jgi:hypothetical protein
MTRSGLHNALLMAVDVLRGHQAPYSLAEQRNAAIVLREYLGRKRLNSKLSMRRQKAKQRNGTTKFVRVRNPVPPQAHQGRHGQRHHA